MAIFGQLKTVKNQLTQKEFQIAFDYLENISAGNLLIKEGDCFKEMITDDIFVLKQAYYTKNRENCFFESHKKYIDIQYIIKGEEIMDVSHIDNLEEINSYDEETDFIKYSGNNSISSLYIKEKELQFSIQKMVTSHVLKPIYQNSFIKLLSKYQLSTLNKKEYDVNKISTMFIFNNDVWIFWFFGYLNQKKMVYPRCR